MSIVVVVVVAALVLSVCVLLLVVVVVELLWSPSGRGCGARRRGSRGDLRVQISGVGRGQYFRRVVQGQSFTV